MFGLGTPELLLLCFIVLLLFGKKLPSTMKSLGGSVRSFREGMSEEQKLLPK
ncbi:twin-arginine translocase TatA/TatE family subunit [Thalassoglobus polymorphus]|uniref:Sec-independent protein translocase protein TatA n=1 Tax=Thalassoglobus polymorphus TaxID=2527994 RepID=A0A517QJ42_9PLAN|nr:twin-arginine translocase TatA/TatE family subunit [Thalassoglobus polymorphus]QDT31636.1 twin arginine translocase protein A [Thalassoglobus polymorphus]